jgi:hypothetical protein
MLSSMVRWAKPMMLLNWLKRASFKLERERDYMVRLDESLV